MPHGNVHSEKATAQNAATDPEQPRDTADADASREARTYAAADVRESAMAAPAAGEVGDYADLDEPTGGMAQGATHNNRETHAHRPEQGPKTQAANRARSGSNSRE